MSETKAPLNRKMIYIIVGVVAVVAAAGMAMSGVLNSTSAGGTTGAATEATQASAPSEGAAQPTGTAAPNATSPAASQPAETVIHMTDSGFSPSSVTVSKGDTVKFVSDEGLHWPASNNHPTHTLYPGSNINKCGSSATIFDACGGLGPGESFSFKFDIAGTWGFHDHLMPSHLGTVTVQ